MSGIKLGMDYFSTYEEGIKREWITGNRLGGYASSTIIGARTRTYHGLLVAALENSPGRVLLLSSLDEEIYINEEIYRLATHKYPDTICPTGFDYLSELILVQFPLWIYQSGTFTVKKRVFTVHKNNNDNITCVLYDITSRKEGASLRIFPLVNSRDFHFTVRSEYLSFIQEACSTGVKLESSNGFEFSLLSNLQYISDPRWYYNLEYDAEKERGLNYQEDNFNPGYFESKLKFRTSHFFIAASTGNISFLTLEQVDELYTKELSRQNLLASNSKLTDPFALKLLRATDTFIVRILLQERIRWLRDTTGTLPGGGILWFLCLACF